MAKKKTIYIISGGTFTDVAPHFALSAPAFGKVGRELLPHLTTALKGTKQRRVQTALILTRMALGGTTRSRESIALLNDAGLEDLRTNTDLEKLVDHLIADVSTKGIVLATATCDFAPTHIEPSYNEGAEFGRKTHARLSSASNHELSLTPTNKLISRIRQTRKDIFLVGFKTTAGKTPDEQYLAGLKLMKNASCNLVLSNDIRTQTNMIITPEQARYHETTNRQDALQGLAEMIALRSKLTFTRSTIVDAEPVPWNSSAVPESLRTVVNYCIKKNAYKPFLNATVGHFAIKLDDDTILTSRRKTDFNKLNTFGLVKIEAEGPNTVVAHGSKPSVGGQSQRIIFKEHPDVDCIVHFHCPKKATSDVPVRSQREFECGSHECGQNTSSGIKDYGNIKAVMLDKHGPNIVFNKNTDPQEVINFIEEHFDLKGRTDDLEDAEALAPLMFMQPAHVSV